MRVAITGVTGMIGSALAHRLVQGGRSVVPISRTRKAGSVFWDPVHGILDPAALEAVDAVFHFSGAPIAGRRWTRARKRELRDSRVHGTTLIAETIARLRRPPAVLVSASAVGIYGDTGDNVVDEDSPLGSDFLGQLGRDWEAAAEPARAAGLRVVHPRIGIVLSPDGGALARMLPFFRSGLGGRFGSGGQWMSWITLHDVISAMEVLLEEQRYQGPVNLTAPEPVTNAEFAATLGRSLHRPALLPAPARALRMILGELADVALLAGQRVRAARLQDGGFGFSHPRLDVALDSLLGN